jgi:glyoxylase-like metal-dependent hydrolase (beta-lactamase superfamily II)
MTIPSLTYHPAGITAIDTRYLRPQMDASHVIAHKGRAAIVDTGVNSSVPMILATLDELGLRPEHVDFVFLTHVHLDHAGGAAQLMQHLPAARLVVHPRGAPHMTDPAKLIAGSIAVYGADLYRQLYGEIVAIPAERVLTTTDGQRLSVGGREFEFVHTPGHALHHQAIVDHHARSIFTGDTFGISYREFDTERGAWIMPTTTPTQFDPAQLAASIDRLLAFEPSALYLTHYSRVTDAPRLGAELKRQVQEYARIATTFANAAEPHAAIRRELRECTLASLREHGCRLDEAAIDALLSGDFELNAAGLVAWVERAGAKRQ